VAEGPVGRRGENEIRVRALDELQREGRIVREGRGRHLVAGEADDEETASTVSN